MEARGIGGGGGYGPLLTSAVNSMLLAQDRVNLAGEQLVGVSSPPTSRSTASGITRQSGVSMPDRYDTPYSSQIARASVNLSYATMGYTAAAALVKVSEAVNDARLNMVA